MIVPNVLRETIDIVLFHLQPEIPHSYAARELLMLTCATESHLGRYLMQNKGPARGIFQMEPATERCIHANYLRYHLELRDKVDALYPTSDAVASQVSQMIFNIPYQIAMARIHYRRVPKPLPKVIRPTTGFTIMVGEIYDLAAYWKQFYNTPLGKGTIKKAIDDYRMFTE